MKKKIFSVVVFFTLITSFNFAQDFNDALRLSRLGLGQSARSLGMGNTFIAVGGDYSSVYFNPAGLGLMKNAQLQGGINYSSFKANSTLFGNQTDFNLNKTNLNHIGFAYPFPVVRGSFVIAMGYDRLNDFNSAYNFDGFNAGNTSMIQELTSNNDDIAYNLGLSYPTYDSKGNYLKDETLIDGKLRQRGNLINEGGTDAWAFSGAIEIAKNFFFGATLNLISGSYKSKRNYYEEDVKDYYPQSLLLDSTDPRTRDFQSFFLNDVINWDLSGWNLNLGFLYKLKFFKLGAAIQFPTKYTIKETYTVYGESYFQDYSFRIDPPIKSTIEYDITTPFTLSGGASATIGGLTLAADAVFVDYTQMEFTGGLQPNLMSSNNDDIKNLFRSTFNYSFGGEFKLPHLPLVIRAGYLFRKAPYKADPPAYDRIYYTLGAGFKASDNIELDFAYVQGSWQNYADNYGYNVSRVYQSLKKNNFVFTIKYGY